VALLLVYAKSAQIRTALETLDPPPGGAAIALAVGSFEVLMLIGDVGFAAGLGIPLVLAAGAYAIGGRRLLRPLVAPLAFPALIVPPPSFLLQKMLLDLKLLVTEAAVALLQLGGKTVMAEGNQILIPGHTLFVADACSGLTSIVTMIPLACIVAYFMCRGVWRRAVVIGCVIPFAMLANLLRVVITVLLVSRLGVEAAQGMLHEGFGMTIYAIGTLAVIGVARAVR